MPKAIGWKKIRVLLALLTTVCTLSSGAVSAQAQDLQKVLSQMDTASVRFQDCQADITADLFTQVVQDHEIQKGTTAFRRVRGAIEMVTHIQTDNGQASPRDLLYKDGQLVFYQPALKQATIFAAGANRGEYDSLLATGFGASGKELTSAWTVTFQGMESVNGVSTAKLDLVPKQQSVRNYFTHLTVWIDLTRDISLKQLMYQPSGDTRTVTYSNIRYNSHLPASMFDLHFASGTQVQHR